MIHGIRNSFLYASSYIINHSTSSDGKDYCSCGTGFWVKNGHDELCLITNKHVLQNCADSNKLCDFFDIYIFGRQTMVILKISLVDIAYIGFIPLMQTFP